MQNRLVGVAFEVSRRHTKLHAFAKQLMGVACRTYAYTQTCEVEVCFTTGQQKGPVTIQSHSRLIINIYYSHIL